MNHRLQENEGGTVERVGVFKPESRPHVVEVYTEWWPGGKFKFGSTHEDCPECERLEIDDPVKTVSQPLLCGASGGGGNGGMSATGLRSWTKRIVVALLLIVAVTASGLVVFASTTETVKLIPSDVDVGDRFGRSVAIDGDTLVVGARQDDDNGIDSGSAYVFTRESGTWGQTVKLTALDGAAYDWFGHFVAVDGDTIAVGAHQDDDSGDDSGSVYVFIRESGVWSEAAKLTAPDGAAFDWFGQSVAVDGGTVVVGAYRNDDIGSNSGSAYVFTKPTGGWAATSSAAKLTASDAGASDHFGFSVAIDGDTVVVGAYADNGSGANFGSAYVFTKPTDGWVTTTETAKLTALNPAEYDVFGYSVAVDGDTVVAGAHQDDDNGNNSGSAYVLTKPVGGWVTTSTAIKLTALDGSVSDFFGHSVMVDGETIVVGAHASNEGASDTGSAYVFTKPTGGWAATSSAAKLIASDGTRGDHLGYSVAVSGATVVAGAYRDGDNSGSVYVFTESAEVWVPEPSTGWGTIPAPEPVTGPQGSQGEPGAQGTQGLEGIAGPPGPQGLEGPEGPRGLRGRQGAEGDRGSRGLQGPRGSQGQGGVQGDTGSQGATGAQGIQGPQGLEGPQGVGGVQGETGPQGESGAQGPQGPQGLEGSEGLEGPQGAGGMQGETGTKGEPGAQGTQGPQGLQGPQGVGGVQGETGAQGKLGNDGPRGSQGLEGIEGAQGLQGPQGSQGVAGLSGSAAGMTTLLWLLVSAVVALFGLEAFRLLRRFVR